MRKKIHFLLAFSFFISLSYGQSKLWTKISEEKLSGHEKNERASTPSIYQIMRLDLNAFKQSLQGAPIDTEGVFSNTVVYFPNSNGELAKFRVYEAPIMEKRLADRYPDIKSYVALGIDNPTVKLRFSVTLFGLHAMSLSGDEGTYYIDTFTKDLRNYIIYNRNNIQATRTFGCLVQDNHEEVAEQSRSVFENQTLASDGVFRQYRMAMACTIEYAAFHVAAAGLNSGTLTQKKAAVLAAMNVTMTRVNGIYERDMSLRMNLVGNNDSVIFIDSDNFSNDDAGLLIDESQTIIDGIIGLGNYDIGHTVSTGGGGLAQLNSPCSSNKARGITGSPAPVGDPFDIDYVAHEIGHQFGATHTFNNSCGGNRSAGTSVEPGSGSTIMAYAGICAPNVQTNSDAYFHAVSLGQMAAFVSGAGNCSTNTVNGNSAPIVTVTNYTIPRGTAFVLKGSATDANGDSLTYCWEQTNTGTIDLQPLVTNTNGPNFRSTAPISSPNRYMPAFSSVLNGGLATTWEAVPNVARTMNFALTARDNRVPNGGQTGRGNMTVTTASVGPFNVTSPAANASWNISSSQTITWNVAGTTANGINTANVNILISTDGGANFTTLLANTPNDGNQVVTMPATPAVNCRIMIEAVGNIFYAVSPNFAIGYITTTTCNNYTMNTGFAIPDDNTTFTVRAINVPSTTNISDVNLAVDLTHTWVSDLQIILQGPMVSTTQATIFNQSCTNNDNINATFDDQGTSIVCASTITGNVIPSTPLSVFNGLNPNGNWLVAIRDLGASDTGSVISYTLTVCSQQATLTTENFGLESFTLYPNPNNGNFNIQFTSNSNNEIKVNVHDMRGREVFQKSYSNNGLFNESLELNNIQSGIYLVTVQDGARKEVKKIVVQ